MKSIRIKLTLIIVGVTIIPITILALILGNQSYQTAREAIEFQAREHLVSIREIKARQIEDYFSFINEQVLSFANDRMIIDAMQAFNRSFKSYREQSGNPDIPTLRQQLQQYYVGDYGGEYAKRNNGNRKDTSSMLQPLDDDSIALQHAFIRANSHPLGEKDALIKLPNDSDYAKAHALYHPHIREYLNRFGYYDIFMADPDTGDIVYSVFKELDYTTSLKTGPYASSGIGEAFKGVLNSSGREVKLTDFASYTPSYEDPASFIATSIYSKGKKIGILIFQMPIDKINQIMTYDQQWEKSGLGLSGETYLVGANYSMRSMSRFLIEDPEGYTAALQQAGIQQSLIDVILSKGTTIGLQPVETEGTKAAISGTTDYRIFEDYREVPVLSAFGPLGIPGLKWAIMSEIDEEEAFAEATALRGTIINTTIAAIVLFSVAAYLLSVFISRLFTKPITQLEEDIRAIEQNSDLTRVIELDVQDEVGRIAEAINAMLGKFNHTVKHITQSVQELQQSAQQMANLSASTAEGVMQQQAESEQVAAASTQMNSTSQSVAQNADSAATATDQANELSDNGIELAATTLRAAEELVSDVAVTSETMSKVSDDSQQVATVLDVIRSIAEQTNLLALNAAIEAARAGDQGRGFAVVADEVRTLAQRTQVATEEIQEMIENLKAGTTEAVNKMSLSVDRAQNSKEQVEHLSSSLGSIRQLVSDINEMNALIATAASEQQGAANDINGSIVRINDISTNTANDAQSTEETGRHVEQLARQLESLVSEFKV